MSQKMGVSPLLTMAWVVEAKMKGVVMTSPVRPMAWSTPSRARWPLVNNVTVELWRNSRSSVSNF